MAHFALWIVQDVRVTAHSVFRHVPAIPISQVQFLAVFVNVNKRLVAFGGLDGFGVKWAVNLFAGVDVTELLAVPKAVFWCPTFTFWVTVWGRVRPAEPCPSPITLGRISLGVGVFAIHFGELPSVLHVL